MGATVILQDLVISSRVNLQCEFLGIDSLEHCLNKNYFQSYLHPVDYVFNSRGFRDSEWPKSLDELKNAIWCVGDSFTVGIGQPIKHTWPQVLSEATGRRCINISMDGASNDWISRRAQQIVNEIAPAHMVIVWSYPHRREHDNTNWPDQARRIAHLGTLDEFADFKNFTKCFKQLNTTVIATDIFNSIIPNYRHNCNQMWNDIRDPTWPAVCPRRGSEFAALPEYVQQELLSQPDIKTNFELMFAYNEFFDYHNVLELTYLDYARDYHHFDNVTSEFFVQQIYKTLFSNS